VLADFDLEIFLDEELRADHGKAPVIQNSKFKIEN